MANTSVSSRRANVANRAYTNYSLNISRINDGGNASTRYTRRQYMGLSNG